MGLCLIIKNLNHHSSVLMGFLITKLSNHHSSLLMAFCMLEFLTAKNV